MGNSLSCIFRQQIYATKSKKKIDKLINKGYNINEISNYANNEYAKGKYDEMYTEYRVKKLLGE